MITKEETKKELRLVQWQADMAVRKLFMDAAEGVEEAVLGAASTASDPDLPVITPQGREQVLTAVDKVLDTIYGTRKGGPSPLADAIETSTISARRRVYRNAARDMMERLTPDLKSAVRKAYDE